MGKRVKGLVMAAIWLLLLLLHHESLGIRNLTFLNFLDYETLLNPAESRAN